MTKDIRVRFAPSPTGPLHIGGVRTALYNFLFARHHGGTMILRIEDTDQTRYVKGAEDYIMDALQWCGIEIDEGIREGGPYGPYRQSERKEIYAKYAEELIDKDLAYYAFDSAEELDHYRDEAEKAGSGFVYGILNRNDLNNSIRLGMEKAKELIENGTPYVIRFKISEDQNVVMQDIIRGQVIVQSNTLDDKILFKSDGMPTYHLANIVDDHLMKISHVIRGEEWLPSLPLHILLYQAFDWQAPEFAHLPLLLKPAGNGKLSKRDGDKLGFPVFPTEWINPETSEKSMGYREEGYFPQAFLNMLALLGWHPTDDRELFDMQSLIEAFSLERVNKSGARFDPDKAKWFNQQYLKETDDAVLAELFTPFLESKTGKPAPENLAAIVGLVKERAVFVKDIWEQASFFFVAPVAYDEKAVKKNWKEDSANTMLELKEILSNIEDFTVENTEAIVKEWIAAKEYSIGKVMNAFRLALVGESKGPHIFDIIAMIGKSETLLRIENAVAKLSNK